MPTTVLAHPAPQSRAVDVGDMDRKAEPCTDLYQLVNGTWRAKNPMPSDPPRWSRRWRAGENDKAALQQISEVW